MSYSDVIKYNYYVSTKDGGQRGDSFSLCTNTLAPKMGWRGGRESKERYIRLLHLQPYSNLVKLKLQFVFPFCLSIGVFQFFTPPIICFPTLPPSPYLSCLCFPSLYLPLLCLLIFFGRNSGFYYPTSTLPGWVRCCSGVVFTWQFM